MQPIFFPDVEAALVGYLSGLLDVPVLTSVPNPRPASFVRVRRTGGVRTNLVTDGAQVTIEAWANDTVAASGLARTVRAHIGALPGKTAGGVLFGRPVEFSGPANLPDPTSGQARYSWTVQVPVRGHAI